jgi:hypothetical protein
MLLLNNSASTIMAVLKACAYWNGKHELFFFLLSAKHTVDLILQIFLAVCCG